MARCAAGRTFRVYGASERTDLFFDTERPARRKKVCSYAGCAAKVRITGLCERDANCKSTGAPPLASSAFCGQKRSLHTDRAYGKTLPAMGTKLATLHAEPTMDPA